MENDSYKIVLVEGKYYRVYDNGGLYDEISAEDIKEDDYITVEPYLPLFG